MSDPAHELSIDWLTSLKSLDQAQIISTNINTIIEELDKPAPKIGKLKSLISTEPLLSAKLLHICNSPFFGFPRTIDDIEETIVLLGYKKLKSLVFTSILLNKSNNEQLTNYIKHSLTTALICRELYRYKGLHDETGYLTGLLHILPVLINYQTGIEKYLTAAVLQKASTTLFDRMNMPDQISQSVIELYSQKRKSTPASALKLSFNMAIILQGAPDAVFKKISNLEFEIRLLGISPMELAELTFSINEERKDLINLIR